MRSDPLATRLTLKQNVVMRLVGLLMFVAPNHGADFMAQIIIKTNREVAKKLREAKETSLAA